MLTYAWHILLNWKRKQGREWFKGTICIYSSFKLNRTSRNSFTLPLRSTAMLLANELDKETETVKNYILLFLLSIVSAKHIMRTKEPCKTACWQHRRTPPPTTVFSLQEVAYLLVGAGKENEKSWFQKGSFSEIDSVPDSFFKYSFLGRSLILLLFDPIFCATDNSSSHGHVHETTY